MFGRNEMVKLLLSQGADPHLIESRGLIAYDLAMQQGNKVAADLLTL